MTDYLLELYEIARNEPSTQNKHWTTSKGFEEDRLYWTISKDYEEEKMLIKQKLPFVPLVIPQYNRLDN